MWPVPIEMSPGLLGAVADDVGDDRRRHACSHHPWKLLEGVGVEGASFDVAVKGGQVRVVVEYLLITISLKKKNNAFSYDNFYNNT